MGGAEEAIKPALRTARPCRVPPPTPPCLYHTQCTRRSARVRTRKQETACRGTAWKGDCVQGDCVEGTVCSGGPHEGELRAGDCV